MKFYLPLLKLFVLVACVATAIPLNVQAKEVVNKIIAIVNSEPILQSELSHFPQRLKQEGGIDDSLVLDEAPISALKTDSKKQLDYLIREKMIQSEVKKLNLNVSDDRVKNEMTTLATRNHMNKNQLNDFIKKQGYSTAEYHENLKSRLERQAFYEAEVISKLRITDEDAYNEFRLKNPNYIPSLNEYTLAQILVPSQKIGEAAAMEKALTMKKRMTGQETFESVANAYNEGSGAANDGVLGTFKAGEFNREIEAEIARLSVGEVSQPIKTKQGVHIVKVLNKKNSQDPQFVKIKDQIKSYLVEKNFKRQLKNWFESKKQDSYIKIL
ncbi:MAG: peptidylprolyl isomerase [Bdellovibrionaceae bacterium]|nr:peptidylprolyl isomerase [Pseudobdellovibrionaceae bacterium]